MDNRYNKTVYACFVAYVVQAIIGNFAPLLFLTFQRTYDISFNSISLLITTNFCVQLAVDLLAVKVIDKIGYGFSLCIAHMAGAVGLVGLTVLPEWMPDPFWGLMASVIIYSIGAGIMEVLISPIVETCPTKNKKAAMSLLHSFYCWGYVVVILLSTLFFTLAGIENWRVLAWLWAVIPVINGIVFTRVPIAPINIEGEKGLSVRQLFRNKLFWIMFAMMLCSGASEHGVGQWASAFAEKALGVSKAVGDLAGPLSFAVSMGIARSLYAKFSAKISLEKFMFLSGSLCVISYLMVSLSPNPALSFLGCALCGLSVGIMWPGTLSLGASGIKGGGTAMFALFALAGDVGCSVGPALIGFVSEAFSEDLKKGFLAGVIFPAGLVLAILAGLFYKRKALLGKAEA